MFLTRDYRRLLDKMPPSATRKQLEQLWGYCESNIAYHTTAMVRLGLLEANQIGRVWVYRKLET